VVGTEMNAPGNKFVDDFDAPELQPLVPTFLRGAYIVYGHSILEPSGHGYLSGWATEAFPSTDRKNRFFESVGRGLTGASLELARSIPEDATPEELIARVVGVAR